MAAYWKDDPADVSLNAVCALAAVSKPALYRVFGSEDGFVRAVLSRYAETVLSEIFDILARGAPLSETLTGLIRFASLDAKMQTGCVFFKMRAGQHRLGPQTRDTVSTLESGAVNALQTYFETRQRTEDWYSDLTADQAARYVFAQIGLALTQRAAGEDSQTVYTDLVTALSVLRPG